MNSDDDDEQLYAWTYELRDKLAYLRGPQSYDRLTKWEQRFVDKIGSFRKLSQDQFDKLEEIWEQTAENAELRIQAEESEHFSQFTFGRK